MAGKFIVRPMREININDSIFDSLKTDYPGTKTSTGFVEWFAKKANHGQNAIVFEDEIGLGAFIVLKEQENEVIRLTHRILPSIIRTKISTLKLAERFRGQRFGEGAIGLILWQWQKYETNEIYVTVHEKYSMLIDLLDRFGFMHVGKNVDGECVYIKSKSNIDYRDPYKAFPFINPQMDTSGYLIVNDYYHDTMFPYSELKNTVQRQLSMYVANGLTKCYIGKGEIPPYKKGDPVLVYRRYTEGYGSGYKSCITSYCVITDVFVVKSNGRVYITFEDLWRRIRNKTVFTKEELQEKYADLNLIVIEMLYYGYFGAGNNVNWWWLKNNGFWPGKYPSTVRLSKDQFIAILKEGDVDVSNVIID